MLGKMRDVFDDDVWKKVMQDAGIREAYFRPARAAKYLDKSERTLETMRRQRKGPSFIRLHAGRGGVYYPKSELDKWLQSHLIECDGGTAE
jgi:hypothetical protein